MNSLVTFSQNRPVTEVKLATVGIISILGNIRAVFFENRQKKNKFRNNIKTVFKTLKALSNYLNKRQSFLTSDYSTSNTPPAVYDTDLENFWTQKSMIHKIASLIKV
jgi:hypothetical protein